MKKSIRMIVLIAFCFGLASCSEDCTEETLKAKGVELTEKLKDATASGDLGKIMGMAQKMAKYKNLANDKNNLEAACQAVDELLADF